MSSPSWNDFWRRSTWTRKRGIDFLDAPYDEGARAGLPDELSRSLEQIDRVELENGSAQLRPEV